MMIAQWLFWGVVATLAQTVVEEASIGLRLTRMTMPLLLGTMWTANRDRANVAGFIVHLVSGVIFTVLYVIVFHFLGASGWWRGALTGLAHAAVLLMMGMKLLPCIHPRMASESAGATAKRQLEPPGYLAWNYGPGTPVTIVVSHVIFGMVLGAALSPAL